jgi:small subunit ribosomal protein S17
MKNEQKAKSNKKTLTGVVVSNKASKTLVVEVVRKFKHGMYHKFVKRTKKFYAHDEAMKAKEGDTVVIVESRPYSKTKTWELLEIKK